MTERVGAYHSISTFTDLPWQFAARKDLPALPGVYAITLGRRLLYIGTSRNLRKRLFHHQIELNRIGGLFFDGDVAKVRVRYIPCHDIANRLTMEAFLIHLWKPELNTCFARPRWKKVGW
jgi:excinuclease UvrABC nuclease subunit